MKTVVVRTTPEPSSSTVVIQQGGLSNSRELLSVSEYSSVAILGDTGAENHVATVARVCEVTEQKISRLSGGERCKSLTVLASVWEFLTKIGADRRTLLICVGGGAITDLGGFAAATYMRGIPVAYIPTTLLAQVDASVGGKSGINFNGVKNVVGSFQQPRMVLIDPETLSTLPEKERISGFSEIVKHGLITDREYFEKVTERACKSLDIATMTSIIATSCDIKAEVVMSDEREMGPRKLLNFGHTIGHAIEGYFLSLHDRDSSIPALLHGEAIAVGMIAESFIATKLGLLSQSEFSTIEEAFVRTGLPTRLLHPCSHKDLSSLIAADKKKRGKDVMWTLLKRIGEGVFDITVPAESCNQAIQYIQPG